MDTAPQPRNEPLVPEDAWHRCIRLLLLRAPCFLPFASVAGAAVGGQGWALPIASISCAYMLGMRRMLLMCLFCALLVFLRTSQHDTLAAEFVQQTQRSGFAELEGTVVREMSRGCVVDPGRDRPDVLLRGDVPFRCGDTVRVVGSLRETREPLYPGMFDTAQWLRGQGIAAELDFIRGEVTGHPFSWAGVRGYASAWRGVCERVLMPPGTESDPRRQLLCALVLGDKQYADPELMLDFRRGGCLHVFAVSGLHVGLVAGLLWLVVRLLRLKPVWARGAVPVLTGLYVALTGMALPAVRAYLMLVLVLGGGILQRQVSLLNIWCFAGMALLIVSPWQVCQSSFLLSFAVYGAICVGWRLCMSDRPWFGPDAYIPFRIMTRREKNVKTLESWVRGLVMVSVVAWIAALPLTMSFFHAFNLYGILTNIAIAPLLPLVMGAGMFNLCVGWVPWLGGVAGWLAIKSAGVLLAVVGFFAGLPYAYLPVEAPRAEQESVIVSLGFGNSVCLLGNKGLLIDCGSERSARFTVQPLLFHMGFTPAAMLGTRELESRCGGKNALAAMYPDMACLPCGENGTSLSLQTAAGSFRIYYPPADLPRTPAVNMAPVVTWHSGDTLLVYVGDASLATLEQVREDLSAASVLVLGHNPGQIVDADFLRERMPSARVILLPSAVMAGVRESEFAPAEVTATQDDTSYHLFRLEPGNKQ